MTSLLDLVRDDRIRDNLSAPPGAFVGRRLELERLASLLAESGAVQLIGPPGVGKSRLATEFGRNYLTRSTKRSAWFCDLTTAEGPIGALAAIGQPLALSVDQADESAAVERIGAVLDSLRSVALLIDNAEAHADLLEPWLGTWRSLAPHARFVVTTRRSIGDLPSIDIRPLKATDAVGLLEDRIVQQRPDFRPDARTREDLERLAMRLEGLPLAIELVAPRLRLLSPRQILEQLDLAEGPLEAALDRSWDLLGDDEQRAFARSSVFRGGFDVTAAEAVIGGPDATTLLSQLLDHSLLHSGSIREFPDEPRLRYPVAVRDFAARKLDELGERDDATQKHSAYFVDRGETWDDGIDTGDEVASTRRLVVEHPNLLAAWEHADGAVRVRLGLVLHMALQRGGPFHRVFDVTWDSVERAEQLDNPRLLGRALLNRSRAQRWKNEFDASIDDLERALTCAREAGDFRTEASTLRNLAAAYWGRGELGETRAFADEAVARSVEEDDVVSEINSRNGLGFLLAHTGELDAAQQQLETALQLTRTQANEPGLIALVCSSLAALMAQRGTFDRAELYATEALEAYRTVDHVRAIPMELLARAEARAALGNFDDARTDVDEALRISERAGFRLVGFRARYVAGFVELLAGNPAATLDHALRAIAAMGDGGERNLLVGARLHAVIARSLQQDVPPAEQTWAEIEVLFEDQRPGRWADLAEVTRGFLALAQATANRDEEKLAVAREISRRRFEGDAVADLLAELLANALPADDTATFRITADGRRFQAPGDSPVDITRRKALRGILALLVERRRDAPGTPAPLDDVLEAGWPGEIMTPESGAQRVYVTVKRMRDLGLEAVIVTAGDGYMLDPAVDVAIEDIG